MDSSFDFVSFNVNQAFREEQKKQGFEWDARVGKILELLKEAGNGKNLKLMCIQELRNLSTSKMTVDDFVAAVTRIYPSFTAIVSYYNDTQFSFAGAIFYDRFFFRMLRSQQIRYDTERNPEHVRTHQVVVLEEISSGKELTVVNVHMGMDEDHKWKGIDALDREFGAGRSRGSQIIAGDFNLFDDRQGHQMREHLLETWSDASYPLVHVRNNGEKVSYKGTFFGYSHDDFHRPLENMAKLDHVLIHKIQKLSYASFVNLKNAELVRDEYPSDHCLVLISMMLF